MWAPDAVLLRQLQPTMSSSSSDEDVPLAARAAQRQAGAQGTSNGAAANGAGARRPARSGHQTTSRSNTAAASDDSDSASSSSGSDSDSDDDVPLSQRTPKRPRSAGKPQQKAKAGGGAKRKREAAGGSRQPSKRAKAGGGGGKKDQNEPKWTTLEHNGVLFPPEYSAHGVKMLYDGKPVDLTPEQEEVASMFAIMKETDYMAKPKFLANFWEGFKVRRAAWGGRLLEDMQPAGSSACSCSSWQAGRRLPLRPASGRRRHAGAAAAVRARSPGRDCVRAALPCAGNLATPSLVAACPAPRLRRARPCCRRRCWARAT